MLSWVSWPHLRHLIGNSLSPKYFAIQRPPDPPGRPAARRHGPPTSLGRPAIGCTPLVPTGVVAQERSHVDQPSRTPPQIRAWLLLGDIR